MSPRYIHLMAVLSVSLQDMCCCSCTECDDGSARIVDASGSLSTEGRVEYCLGGRWGSVCRSGWDDDDAEVVCRQLGITEANGKSFKSAIYPHFKSLHFTPVMPRAIQKSQTPQAGSLVPIVLDSVNCNGREGSLSECHRATYVEGCAHARDVGANCTQTIGKLQQWVVN